MLTPRFLFGRMDGSVRFMDMLAVLALILSFLVALNMALVPLSWQNQSLLALALFVFSILLNRRSKAHWVTLTLVGISIFFTTRYAYWRLTETLGIGDPHYRWYDFVPTFILLAAELYAWTILVLGYIQTSWPLQRRPVPLPPNPQSWPDVDVYIPTYNEPLNVVEPTVIAALNMDWPEDKLHVHVLDDGTRDEFRVFAKNVGANYITRPEHKHAKAGNLNHALEMTEGRYIAIFDCDHVPARSFLQVTMGWMERDAQIALLQTPHHFYSPDPFERNLEMFHLVPNEGELFYGIVQDGNDLWDATFFCGSCAVLRRDALLGIGGIAVDTVTEDAHTALRLQRQGWRTAYLNIPQAAGLATENLASHVGQRIRWARGMAQIFRMDNPLLGRGLNFWQRLCYLNAMLHFFFAIPRLVFLTAPLAYLLFGLKVLDAYAVTFAAYSLPHLFMASMTNSRIQGRHRFSFWNEIYETILAPYILLPVWLAIINPKLGKFNVTAKGGTIEQSYFDHRIAKPYMVLWLLNVAGLVAAVLRLTLEAAPDIATIVMTSLWTLYNLMIIGAALAVSREKRQVRNHVRIPVRLPIDILSEGQELSAFTQDISDGGLSISVPGPMAMQGEELVRIRVYWGNQPYEFPARVIDHRDGALRMAFGDLNLGQRVQLVRLLYTRADAWLGWGEGRAEDRPLTSLWLIGKIALKGSLLMIQGLFAWRRRAVHVALMVGLLSSGFAALFAARDAHAAEPRLLFAHSVPAPITAPTASAHSAGTFEKTWTLTQLGYSQGIHLTGVNGQQVTYFNVPQNELIRSATVTVHLRYSPGLLARISQINLLLNGSVIGSYPIPEQGTPGQRRTFKVAINPFQITTYNHFGFQLIGHYTQQCEDPSNSTLWADILPKTSIHIQGTLLNLADRLSLLPAPFYYHAGQGEIRVPFFVVLGEQNPHMLEAAGVVASWFGTLENYRQVKFPILHDALPQGNAVIFVDLSEGVPSYLQNLNLPTGDGPFIAVRSNPSDPARKLLLIIGQNGKQVLTAARALVLGHYAMGGSSASIANFSLPPPRKPDDAPRWLSTAKPTPLGALTGGSALEVNHIGDVVVPFRVAPDLFFWGMPKVPLRLRYTYNPDPIDSGSSLVFSLNGKFVGSVGMLGSKGSISRIHTRDLEIPTVRIQPLDNLLDFYFGFQLVKQGACKDTIPDSLRGAVLPDSSLDMSGVPHFTRMPNLSLLSNGGYPFTRYADLSQTAVVLPTSADSSILGTYLNLMGQFGTQTGYPALRITVVGAKDVNQVKGKNLIILGSAGTQPLIQRWSQHLPLVFTPSGGVHAQDLRGVFSRVVNDLPWWEQATDHGHYGLRGLGELLSQGVNPAATMEEIVSPLQDNRVALFLEARDPLAWTELDNALHSKSTQARIFGNLTILPAESGTLIHSFIVPSAHFDVGHLPLWTWIRWRFSQNPWLIAGIILGVAILQGLALSIWLRHRSRRRLEGRI